MTIARLANQFYSDTKTANVNLLISKIKDAISSADWYQVGKLLGTIDLQEGAVVNSAEAIRLMKYFTDPEIARVEIPIDEWLTFGEGYNAATNKSPERRERDIAFTKSITNRIISHERDYDWDRVQWHRDMRRDDPDAIEGLQGVDELPPITARYSEKYNLTKAEYKLLTKIDNSPNHYLDTANMTDDELTLARDLENQRYIQRIPAGHGVTRAVIQYDYFGDNNKIGPRIISPMNNNLPERYVILANGNYALGTFDFDTLSQELRERRQRRHRHR